MVVLTAVAMVSREMNGMWHIFFSNCVEGILPNIVIQYIWTCIRSSRSAGCGGTHLRSNTSSWEEDKEDQEFKIMLGYKASFGSSRAMWDPVSNHQQQQQIWDVLGFNPWRGLHHREKSDFSVPSSPVLLRNAVPTRESALITPQRIYIAVTIFKEQVFAFHLR